MPVFMRFYSLGEQMPNGEEEDGYNSEGPGPAAAGARRVAEDNEEMLKRWSSDAAGLLRDVDGDCE